MECMSKWLPRDEVLTQQPPPGFLFFPEIKRDYQERNVERTTYTPSTTGEVEDSRREAGHPTEIESQT